MPDDFILRKSSGLKFFILRTRLVENNRCGAVYDFISYCLLPKKFLPLRGVKLKVSVWNKIHSFCPVWVKTS